MMRALAEIRWRVIFDDLPLLRVGSEPSVLLLPDDPEASQGTHRA
jgi:hypothetical protein